MRPAATARPPSRRLGTQLGHVLVDLPVFLTSPLDDLARPSVTRIGTTYDGRRPSTVLLGVVLMELGDFAMLRRMLRGIKARAEASQADQARLSGVGAR